MTWCICCSNLDIHDEGLGDLMAIDEQAKTRLIHHAAQRGSETFPPSSLSAIKDCLDAGARAIEIDILPMQDGSFVLLHDPDLAVNTNGKGNAITTPRSDLASLQYKQNGQVMNEKISFLDLAVALVATSPTLEKLQLDLKPQTALTPALIRSLLEVIQPIFERVQVSSVADWAIRALRRASPDLQLGFDPLLYLDVVSGELRHSTVPPFRVGAYGLLDDHPLSAFIWGEKKDYFAARAESLLTQAVPGCEWFIRHETLLQAYASGFNWVDFLHRAGCSVDAWTVDPPAYAAASELLSLGVDEITSNASETLAGSINMPVKY
jgi:glycerophosphoryl diester phosphodiesterase